MAYSNTFLKGRVGFTGDWPVVVMERAKSDKPLTPVLCEVFGYEHEMGSVYLRDIKLWEYAKWLEEFNARGYSHNEVRFKGKLI
jgi:hypothetical protein